MTHTEVGYLKILLGEGDSEIIFFPSSFHPNPVSKVIDTSLLKRLLDILQTDPDFSHATV